MRVLRVAPLLLALLLAAAGCGGDDDAEPATTAAEPPPAEAGEAITEADSGAAFALAPGAETNLQLSSLYAWSDPVVEGGAVELSPVDYLQDPGFVEWLVRAASAGTAAISALGEPACEGEDGCPDEALRFQVTITVAE